MVATVLWWLAQNALLAGVLAGLVALVCRLGRFRPAVRHALWLLVLLKLVTPPLVEWPWRPPILEPDQHAEPVAAPGPAPTPTEDMILALLMPADLPGPAENNPADPEIGGVLASPTPPATEPAALAEPAHQPAPSWWAWLPTALLTAWLSGALIVATMQLGRVLRLRRLVAGGRPASAELAREVEELAAQLGARPPPIRVLAGIVSPFVCGLGRPLLVWPAALEGCLAPECQRAVLVHELAHLRRRDHWVAWLRVLAGCAWWWDPLYWYVCRQLGRAAELACDAWVVGALPDARRAYAEALLAVAQLVSKTAAPAPAVGMSGSRLDFERRLTMVMCERVPCKVPVFGLVLIGLLALAILPGWSLGPRAAEPPAQTTTPSAPVEPVIKLTTSQPEQPAAVAVQQGGDERDRKLKDLEQKVNALLKEVQALRSHKAPAQGGLNIHRPTTTSVIAQPVVRGQVHEVVTPSVTYAITLASDGGQHELALTRVSYKLPKDKADALAAFLPHIKAQVLESKVEGEGIVVTTTPEIQRTIGQLVALLQGKTHEGAARPLNLYNAQPKQP
jgi:beta-lactamase regulating signal transducer with metallopeptidase domain